MQLTLPMECCVQRSIEATKGRPKKIQLKKIQTRQFCFSRHEMLCPSFEEKKCRQKKFNNNNINNKKIYTRHEMLYPTFKKITKKTNPHKTVRSAKA